MTLEKKRAFIINWLFAACLLTLIYLVLHYLLRWMLPFLIALGVAACLQRPINWIACKGQLSRRFVAPLVAALLVVSVAGTGTFLLWNIGSELSAIAARLPDWYNRTSPAVYAFLDSGSRTLLTALPLELQTQLQLFLDTLMTSFQTWIFSFSSAALAWLAGKATQLPSLLISIIVAVVSTFFISVEFESIKHFFRNQIPKKYREIFRSSWTTFGSTLVKMLRSYLLIMFITFVELATGLSLLRLNYAILLAAIISLVDILPVLGTGTVLIPWGLLCLISGEKRLGIGILATYLVIMVVRNILEPKIIGNRIGLHPLVTLVFMYLGLRLLGIPGMFLFPLGIILLKNLQESGAIHLWETREDKPEAEA